MDSAQVSPGVEASESKKPDDGRVSLNTAPVVDRIVRKFATEIIALVGHPDFMARLDFECRRLNGLFLGLTPSDTYLRGPWNVPEQLGEHLLKALRIQGATRLAVRDGCMLYVDKLLDIVGNGGDFDAAAVEALAGKFRDQLMGNA